MNENLKNWIFQETLGKTLFSILCIISLWLFLRIIKAAISNRVKESDARYRSKKLLDFSGFIITFLLIIVVFSSNIPNVSVALGIAGAGIAFALQEVIASIAGWLAVMFGGFYKTGDRVQLGGIKGDVIDIGVLRTTIMEIGQWVDGDLYNGRIVRVANSFVFKEPVFNYSADFPFLWDEIKLSIQYGSDYEKTKELLFSIANDICGNKSKEAHEMWQIVLKKYLIENASTDPMVTVAAKDSCVEFTIRYIVDYQKRRITKDNLFSQILTEIKKTKENIKISTSTIQFVLSTDKNK